MLRLSELASCWSYLGQFPFHSTGTSDSHPVKSVPDGEIPSQWKLPPNAVPSIPNDAETPLSSRLRQVAAHLDRAFPNAIDRLRACSVMAQCIEALAPRFVLVDPNDPDSGLGTATSSASDESAFGLNYSTWSRLRETMIVTLIYYAWAPCAPIGSTGTSKSSSSTSFPCFFSENPFLHAILLAQVEYGRLVNDVAKVAHTLASERPELSAAERQNLAASIVAKHSAASQATATAPPSSGSAAVSNVPTTSGPGVISSKTSPAIALRWEDLRREVSTLERLLIEANLLEVASLAMPIAVPSSDPDVPGTLGMSGQGMTTAQAQAKALATALTASLPGGSSLPHPLSLTPPPVFPRALQLQGGHDAGHNMLGVPLPDKAAGQSQPSSSATPGSTTPVGNPESEHVPFQLAQPDPVCRRIAALPTTHERVAASFARLRALHRFYLHAVVLRNTPIVNQATLTASYQEALQIAGNLVVQSRIPHFNPQMTQPPAMPAAGTPGAAVPPLNSLLPRYRPSADVSLEAFIRHPAAFLVGATDSDPDSNTENQQPSNFVVSNESLAEHKQDEGSSPQMDNSLAHLGPDELKEARTLLERAVRVTLDARQRNRLFALLARASSGSIAMPSFSSGGDASDSVAAVKQVSQLTEGAARTLGIASSGTIGALADSNPFVAVRVLAHLPAHLRAEALNELVQVAGVTLGRVQTVAALAGIADSTSQGNPTGTGGGSDLSTVATGFVPTNDIISEAFVRQFLASAFSRCRQLPDQAVQQRFARALVVFVTALGRRYPTAVTAMSDEIKNFCVEFTKVFGTSELYQQLC